MKWVITYDIESDGVRDRIARILLRHGQRVQESVFECSLEDDEVRFLAAAIGSVLGSSGGDVRFYRLCRTCQPDAFGIGEVRPSRTQEWTVG